MVKLGASVFKYLQPCSQFVAIFKTVERNFSSMQFLLKHFYFSSTKTLWACQYDRGSDRILLFLFFFLIAVNLFTVSFVQIRVTILNVTYKTQQKTNTLSNWMDSIRPLKLILCTLIGCGIVRSKCV